MTAHPRDPVGSAPRSGERADAAPGEEQTLGHPLLNPRPVAVGTYLKALRLINGERIYDQAIRLGIGTVEISEFERGEGEKASQVASTVFQSYKLTPPEYAALLRCVEADDRIKKQRENKSGNP